MLGRSKVGPAVTALACLVYGATSALAVGGVTPAPTPAEGFTAAAAQAYEGEGGYDIGGGAGKTDVNEKVRCPRCGKAGDVASAECERCAYDYPLSAGYAGDAETVFFSGKGYRREGALLKPTGIEPAGFSNERVWFNPGPLATTGTVLVIVGGVATIVGISLLTYDLCLILLDEDPHYDRSLIVASTGLAAVMVGFVFVAIDVVFETDGDYAFAPRAPEVGGSYSRPPLGAGGLTFKLGLSLSSM